MAAPRRISTGIPHCVVVVALIAIAVVIAECSVTNDSDEVIGKRVSRSNSIKKQLVGLRPKELSLVNDSIKTAEKLQVSETISDATQNVSTISERTIMPNNQPVQRINRAKIDEYKSSFFAFIGLSIAAMAFIAFKSYRLRLSRAERKYGVQGDRSTQELTPLPVALEDGHSDEDDQTLFEVKRQQMIL